MERERKKSSKAATFSSMDFRREGELGWDRRRNRRRRGEVRRGG